MGTTNTMGIPYPESTDAVANGATAMESLAEAVDVKTGLVRIAGGTQSGTAALNVDSVFTSKFLNYRLVLTAIESTVADRAVRINFRSGGVTNAAFNYVYAYRGLRTNGGSGDTALGGADFAEIGVHLGNFANVKLGSASIDITGPQSNQTTFGTVTAVGYEALVYQMRSGGLAFNDSTIFDGFRISLSNTGDISFKWDLYGYARS